jgi:hypothetical protein
MKMFKLKQPALPMITLLRNEDLLFEHEVYLAFDCTSYVGGLTILGSDQTQEFVIDYAPDHCASVVLEPVSVPDIASDAEPFYMNHNAMLAYNKYRTEAWRAEQLDALRKPDKSDRSQT